jgi:acyl dehydratase
MIAQFAQATGDDNSIHLSDEAAQAAGFPGIVAHGFYTLNLAARLMVGWAGNKVVVLQVKADFVHPVLVPVEGTVVTVSGRVAALLGHGIIRVEFDAECQGKVVIKRAHALVKLP